MYPYCSGPTPSHYGPHGHLCLCLSRDFQGSDCRVVYRAKIIVRLWCVDFWQASPYMLSSAASPHSQVLGASVPPPQFPCSKCHRWQSAHKSIKTPNGIVPFGIDWREAVGLHGVIRLPLSYLQWPCLPTVKVDGKVTEVWTGRLRFSFQLCCKAIR